MKFISEFKVLTLVASLMGATAIFAYTNVEAQALSPCKGGEVNDCAQTKSSSRCPETYFPNSATSSIQCVYDSNKNACSDGTANGVVTYCQGPTQDVQKKHSSPGSASGNPGNQEKGVIATF